MEKNQVVRSVCPRNCPDSCGILTYVKDGKIINIEGDKAIVRALPQIHDGDKLVPRFPFEGDLSSTQVLAKSLTNITIYR